MCQKMGFALATHTEACVCIWYLCHFCMTYVCVFSSQNGKSQAMGRRRNSKPKPSAFFYFFSGRIMNFQMASVVFFFFFFSSSPPPEEKDKQGQNTDRKEAVVSRRTLRMHTHSHLIH